MTYNWWHSWGGNKWMVRWTLWWCAIGAFWLSKPIPKSALVGVCRCWWRVVIDNDLWRCILWQLPWLLWQRVAEFWLFHWWLHWSIWWKVADHGLKLWVNVDASLVVFLASLIRVIREILIVKSGGKFRYKQTRPTKLSFSWQCIKESQFAGIGPEAKVKPLSTSLAEHSKCIFKCHAKHFSVGQVEDSAIVEENSSLVDVAGALQQILFTINQLPVEQEQSVRVVPQVRWHANGIGLKEESSAVDIYRWSLKVLKSWLHSRQVFAVTFALVDHLGHSFHGCQCNIKQFFWVDRLHVLFA